jgi:hypothetical protein
VSRILAADVKARVHMPHLLPTDCKLVKAGRDAYRTQCPIHGGEHLSFSLRRTPAGDWRFNCFSCGESGDVFALVMLLERCTFKEALARLAKDVAPLMAGPAPKRRKPALLLICDGRGCGATRELEAEDRPYVGRTIATSWELRAGRWLCWRCAAGKTAQVEPIEALGARRAA